jgi:branched-chain amino acid transport system permease protein
MELRARSGHRLETIFAAGAVVLLFAWPWLAGLVTGNPRFYTSLVGNIAIIAILTLSLNLAMGYGGLLSIVHTGMLAFAGYFSGVMAIRFGLSVWLAMPLAVVATAIFGALIASVSLRATYLYFGMITLSFNLLVIEVAREWDEVTGGFFGLVGIPRPSFFGTPLTPRQLYLVIALSLVLAYAFQRNIIRSKTGRALQAVRESPDAAAALGVRPGPTKVTGFALSGGMAGAAGALFAHQLGFINPDVGLLDNALVVFVGLLLGGIGTLAGPLLGVAMISVIDQFIRDLGQYRRLTLGVILLIIMLLIPKGIVGTWRASRFGASAEPEEPDEVEEEEEEEEEEGAVQVTDESGRLEAARPTETARGGEPVVEASGITKSFGGIRALAGVDLTVVAEEIHGIIGPNGSGKSTLVNCVTRSFQPDAGEILLFGKPAPRRAWQIAAIGVTRVFQKPHLFERVSVTENVLTGMHLRSRQRWYTAALRLPSFRREERELRREALGYLELAGLHRRAARTAAGLSHGQKRILEVVRAVASRPRVLILDEPATGLTPEELENLADLLRRLRGTGMTVLLIEHNMEFLMGLCDRVTVLDSGKVIAVGTPEEVPADTAVQEAYLGSGDLLEKYL